MQPFQHYCQIKIGNYIKKEQCVLRSMISKSYVAAQVDFIITGTLLNSSIQKEQQHANYVVVQIL